MKSFFLSIITIFVITLGCQAQWTQSGTNVYTTVGNVGIGTTSPASLLHITGNVGSIDILRLGNTDATDGRSTILFTSSKGPQSWQFGENPGGGVGIFGLRDMTTSGFPIRFVVNTSGYMGIGTITPVTLLNVAVPSAKTTVAGNVVSFLSTNDASNAFGLRTMIYGGAAIANRYATLQTTDYSLADGGSLVLQPSTGNVGIGTTTPAAKLNVVGTEAARITGTGTTGVASIGYMSFYDSNNTQRYGFLGDASNVNSDLYFSADIGGLNFGAGGANDRMYINSSGNVGIGTTTPDQKLSVNGTIHSKSVLVDLNGWSDYVFKKDYQLLSLSEVKAYIDRNQHLPGIPSEQEMIKNGLNVSEMNKVLTKKVEELTLYLIEKEKKDTNQQTQIDLQKEQLETQQIQIGAQQKEIDELKSQLKVLFEKLK